MSRHAMDRQCFEMDHATCAMHSCYCFMGHLNYVLIKQAYHFAFPNHSCGSMKLQVDCNLRC